MRYVILMFVLTLDGIRSVERLETLLKRVVLLGSFISSVAVVQFFIEWDPTPWLQPPGLSVNRLLPTVGNRSVVSRVYGTSLHPIEFGVMSSMLAALSIHFALHAKTRGESNWRWALTALITGASLLSVSRSAVVTMAIVFVGYVYVWRPHPVFSARSGLCSNTWTRTPASRVGPVTTKRPSRSCATTSGWGEARARSTSRTTSCSTTSGSIC